MGEGEETKSRVEILERGDIFFFYRPKVDKDEAHGVEEVQRLSLVLRAESGGEEKQDTRSGEEGGGKLDASETNKESGHKDEEEAGGPRRRHQVKYPLFRFIVMGRKTLPDPSRKTRPSWGFVEIVTADIDHIKAALRGEEYDTATRGHRHKPDCRAAGEGVYCILRHNPGSSKMHTHLVYKLEYPPEGVEEKGPQKALNIAREASYLVQIKKPEGPRKAAFPGHLQGLFGQRRYSPADPPDFLNYEGCEFLLISASDNIEEELGLELETDDCSSDLVEIFGGSADSRRPMFEGSWEGPAPAIYYW